MCDNMKKRFLTLLIFSACIHLYASEPWNVERCMQYAADHGHAVRQQRFALDDSHAARTQAIGAFLPSVYGSISSQMNFGRAIDPETNTYTDVAPSTTDMACKRRSTSSTACNATTNCAWPRPTWPWGEAH